MPVFGRKKTHVPVVEEPVERPALPDPPEPNKAGLRSVEDHRDYLLSHVTRLRPFGMQILDAWGQTLCETIVSDIDLPTYTSALVDGYAVRGSDLVGATPRRMVSLPVVATSRTTDYNVAPLAAGTAVRVSAGAPVPEGADGVAPLELTDGGDDQVQIHGEVAFNENLRRAGSDIADGTTLLETGTPLDSRCIGLLAEVGLDKVLVRPRPRVVVLTVGPKLVLPGVALTSLTESYDSTTSMIAAAARADGSQAFPINPGRQGAEELRQILSDQLIRADLIVTIGGLAEDFSVIADILPDLGPTDFCDVAMAPGGRQGFALVGEDKTPVVALPGGAAPAFFGYHAFVRPLIRKMSGAGPLERDTMSRKLAEAAPRQTELTQFLCGNVTEDRVNLLEGGDEARVVLGLTRANAIIVVPAGEKGSRGDEVDCWLLDEHPR